LGETGVAPTTVAFGEAWATVNDPHWHERLRYWFREDVLHELSRIQHAFEMLDDSVQPFFRCAMSHTLKPVS